jgi:hypothetical protein
MRFWIRAVSPTILNLATPIVEGMISESTALGLVFDIDIDKNSTEKMSGWSTPDDACGESLGRLPDTSQ